MTLGEMKKRVWMALDLYSDNGVANSPQDAGLSDIAMRMGAAADIVYRRIRLCAGEERPTPRCAAMSIADKPDTFKLRLAPLAADAMVYGTACELCDPGDPLYPKLNTQYSEALYNLYNASPLPGTVRDAVWGRKRRGLRG